MGVEQSGEERVQTPQAILRLIWRCVRSWRRLLRTTIKAAFNTVSLFLSLRLRRHRFLPPPIIAPAASPRSSGTAEAQAAEINEAVADRRTAVARMRKARATLGCLRARHRGCSMKINWHGVLSSFLRRKTQI